ncbi:cytochrome b5 domain-containing protein [Clostridium sp.]|uniref:cytochrome b5 domain-containing protein n=1 Tax=Clostridium sp. TaxID=1506 RepID=UPI00284E4161|nr:cytochrome b5 domain-containing protein [Clostridium sp.]MDR3597292.1 cytochrome b5 domain-containing protein [Clostridium sp.]
MSIYFEFKTIKELIGKYYREQKQFTLSELAQYDGSYGRPAYVAVNGIVYDMSKEITWSGGKHFNLMAGKDLTEEFMACHGMLKILTKLNKIGILLQDNKNIMAGVARIEEDTYDFSPDDWINYLTPLIDNALAEADEGIDDEHLFQKYILAGVLVGQGMSPEDAIQQVNVWENTGIAQLLDASMRKN